MNQYTNFYYELVLGYFPENEEEINKTNLFFEYLIDAGIEEKVIKDIAINNSKTFLSLEEDLPDYLWENSLLEPHVFYYHNELHIKPEVKFDLFNQEQENKFYLEMKIKYTLEDLLNYMYDNLKIDNIIRDRNRDRGLLKHFLRKYSALGKSIDMVLCLIDYAAENHCRDTSCMLNFENKTLLRYKNNLIMAQANKANKIIWRS